MSRDSANQGVSSSSGACRNASASNLSSIASDRPSEPTASASSSIHRERAETFELIASSRTSGLAAIEDRRVAEGGSMTLSPALSAASASAGVNNDDDDEGPNWSRPSKLRGNVWQRRVSSCEVLTDTVSCPYHPGLQISRGAPTRPM